MDEKQQTGKADSRIRREEFVDIKFQSLKIITGLCFLAILVIAGGLLTYNLLFHRPLSATILPSAIIPSLRLQPEEEFSSSDIHIPFEVYPTQPVTEDLSHPPSISDEGAFEDLPKLCIIIDDMGYHKQLGEDLIRLDITFTISILPYSPHLEYIAKLANSYGHEILLHQPMVPNEYPHFDPGKGAIFLDMLPEEIMEIVNDNIDAIPYAVGVNNHMGSRFTESAEHMKLVLSVIKKRNSFFVDSVTTPFSKASQSARSVRVPFAKRDVFIDHDQDIKFIRKQLELLVKKAIKNRQAIGIGHPHRETYEAIKEFLPTIKKYTEIVPVSELTH